MLVWSHPKRFRQVVAAQVRHSIAAEESKFIINRQVVALSRANPRRQLGFLVNASQSNSKQETQQCWQREREREQRGSSAFSQFTTGIHVRHLLPTGVIPAGDAGDTSQIFWLGDVKENISEDSCIMKSTGSVVTYLIFEFLIPACYTYTYTCS